MHRMAWPRSETVAECNQPWGLRGNWSNTPSCAKAEHTPHWRSRNDTWWIKIRFSTREVRRKQAASLNRKNMGCTIAHGATFQSSAAASGSMGKSSSTRKSADWNWHTIPYTYSGTHSMNYNYKHKEQLTFKYSWSKDPIQRSSNTNAYTDA